MKNNKSKLVSLINEIKELLNNLGVNKESNHEFPVKFFNVLIGERIFSSLNTISICIQNSPLNNGHALGLIMRNILSDFMIGMYVFYKPQNEEERVDLMYCLLIDDIKRVDYFMSFSLKNERITKEFYDSYIQKSHNPNSIPSIIRSTANEIKEENKIRKKANELPIVTPTIKDIFEYFVNSRKHHAETETISKAYHFWLMFSKYEHLSWNSYNFTRNVTNQMILDWCYEVTNIAVISLLIVCEQLNEIEFVEKLRIIKSKY